MRANFAFAHAEKGARYLNFSGVNTLHATEPPYIVSNGLIKINSETWENGVLKK